MAAPMKNVSITGKLIFEKSSFLNEQDKHRKCIQEHCLNSSVSVIQWFTKSVLGIQLEVLFIRTKCFGQISLLRFECITLKCWFLKQFYFFFCQDEKLIIDKITWSVDRKFCQGIKVSQATSLLLLSFAIVCSLSIKI